MDSPDESVAMKNNDKFVKNKYFRWYCSLVERNDVDVKYTEKHHKLPRSMGGESGKNNIVRLSARKHFLAHWLLTKCTFGAAKRKMLLALGCMRRNPNKAQSRVLTAWQYELARTATREAKIGIATWMKGKKHTADSLKKISAAHLNKPLSDEHKQNISAGLLVSDLKLGWPNGRPLTEEHRQKVKKSMMGNKNRLGQKSSDETKEKLSKILLGNTRCVGNIASDKTRLKMTVAKLSSLSPLEYNKSGLRGIWKFNLHGQWTGKWRSKIRVQGKNINLGLFDCPAAAHLAYLVARNRHLGELINVV